MKDLKWDKKYDHFEYTWTAWLRDEENGNSIAVLSQSICVDTPNEYSLKALGLEKTFEAKDISEAMKLSEQKLKSIFEKYVKGF